MRAPLLASLLLTLAWLLATRARATVMIELSAAELAARSDVVAHGAITRTGTRLVRGDEGLEPHTLSELAVSTCLRGPCPTTLTIDELGGERGAFAWWIEGTPRYQVGDEVVVFLRRLVDGRFRTVGMAQGRFEVERAPDGDVRLGSDPSELVLVPRSP